MRPANVIVTKDKHAKFLDVGLSPAALSALMASKPAAGAVGSLEYTAPEAESPPAREKMSPLEQALCDVYSFGLIALEVWTLKGMHEICANAGLPRRRALGVLPGLSKEQEEFVRTCCKKDPRERWDIHKVCHAGALQFAEFLTRRRPQVFDVLLGMLSRAGVRPVSLYCVAPEDNEASVRLHGLARGPTARGVPGDGALVLHEDPLYPLWEWSRPLKRATSALLLEVKSEMMTSPELMDPTATKVDKQWRFSGNVPASRIVAMYRFGAEELRQSAGSMPFAEWCRHFGDVAALLDKAHIARGTDCAWRLVLMRAAGDGGTDEDEVNEDEAVSMNGREVEGRAPQPPRPTDGGDAMEDDAPTAKGGEVGAETHGGADDACAGLAAEEQGQHHSH